MRGSVEENVRRKKEKWLTRIARRCPAHFNEKGARAMAGLVMKELPTAEPRLKPYLKTP
jgi:hypothetical protein